MIEAPLRVALISEHASPLAQQGGVDAGGQNVYVAHVAAALARRGHHVDVLTRRDQRALPTAVDMRPGVRVLHIDAGPPEFVPKEQLLPYMRAFGSEALRLMRRSLRYDVVHANFFMSGVVGLRLQRQLNIPLVQTFHALGAVRRLHQKEADKFPAERIDLERALALLPAGYRTVLVLHDLEGYRHDEIAERLGIAAGTSKSQLFHARRYVRALLEPTHEVRHEQRV